MCIRDRRSSVYTAMALAVGCGALLTLLGVFCSSWILQATQTPADIFRYAEDYMRYYFLGMIPSMIYNMGSGILRAVGDSRRPLYYLIVCCFVNIVLDLFLVLVIPLATAGTAIATSISQLVCASLVLRALLKTRDIYQPVSYTHLPRRMNLCQVGAEADAVQPRQLPRQEPALQPLSLIHISR